MVGRISIVPRKGRGVKPSGAGLIRFGARRRANCRVSVATLTEIVTDPRFGAPSSADMIAKGEVLDNFDGGGFSRSASTRVTAAEVSTSATERPCDAGTTSPR